MSNVSVVIVVKGSPEYLEKSLDSVRLFADEILIGDIGMGERGKDLPAGRQGKGGKVRIIEIEKDVPYVELIREELHLQATGDYIFVLDPDEIVPAALLAALKESMGKYDYVKIPRKNIIFRKWIEHSRWWPDYQVRFFRKGTVTWPKVLHTQPVTSGYELTLDPKEELAIEHHNYENLDEYLLKAIRYAKAQAQEDMKKGEPLSFSHYSKLALSEFIGRYFADDGYKDGMHGFSLAFLQMMYYFLVYFYAWEAGGYKQVPQENLLQQVIQFFSTGLFEISHWSRQKGLVKVSFVKSKLHSLARKLIN